MDQSILIRKNQQQQQKNKESRGNKGTPEKLKQIQEDWNVESIKSLENRQGPEPAHIWKQC